MIVQHECRYFMWLFNPADETKTPFKFQSQISRRWRGSFTHSTWLPSQRLLNGEELLKKSPLFIVHVSALACRRAKPVLMDVNGAYRWKPGGQCLRVVNLFLVTAAIGHSGALRRCNLFAHCCVSRSRLNMVDKMTQVSFSFKQILCWKLCRDFCFFYKQRGCLLST